MNQLKMWAQFIVSGLMLLWAALTDEASKNAITREEWIVIATMFVGGFGVQIVPNLDAGIAKYAKGVVSFLTAALPVITLGLAGGLTSSELLESVIAGAAALGLVVGVRNQGYVFATKRGVNAVPGGGAPPL